MVSNATRALRYLQCPSTDWFRGRASSALQIAVRGVREAFHARYSTDFQRAIKQLLFAQFDGDATAALPPFRQARSKATTVLFLRM
jgi:hypothetical protein